MYVAKTPCPWSRRGIKNSKHPKISSTIHRKKSGKTKMFLGKTTIFPGYSNVFLGKSWFCSVLTCFFYGGSSELKKSLRLVYTVVNLSKKQIISFCQKENPSFFLLTSSMGFLQDQDNIFHGKHRSCLEWNNLCSSDINRNHDWSI